MARSSQPMVVIAMAPIPNPPGHSRGARHAASAPAPTAAPPARVKARLVPARAAPPPVVPPVRIVAMKPIPNPEDMSAAERKRIYGVRHHRVRPAAPVVHRAAALAPAPVAKPAPAPKAAMTKAPVVKPAAPVAKAPPPAAKPAPVAPAAQQAPAPKPAAPPAAAPPAPPKPVVAAKPAPVAAVAPKDKIGRLEQAAAAAVSSNAKLTVAPEIGQGKPGKVSLSLPASLLQTIQAEAAKLGLVKPARKAEVSATLSGEGFSVVPNGKQTTVLKSNEATSFAWQVWPTKAAKGPLKAQIDASLTGQAQPKALSLGAVEAAVATVAADAQAQAGGFHFKLPKLPSFAPAAKKPDAAGPPPAPEAAPAAAAPAAKAGMPMLKERTLPVVGKVSGRTQAAAILAILAVLILALVGRNMSAQRKLAERRRRYRTYQPMTADEAPAEA